MQKNVSKGRFVYLMKKVFHWFLVLFGAAFFTLLLFLVLPLMQIINKPPTDLMVLQEVQTADLPPPPPPVEEEPEEEPEPEEPPPDLVEEHNPLDLSQLELALNPTFNDGLIGGDFAVKLNTIEARNDSLDTIFSMNDLDQKPRAIYQPGPIMNAKLRKNAPGTVFVIFIVDQNGKVVNPAIHKSTNPIFNKAALSAVKQWKFESAKHDGKSVRSRMRIPITFPKG